MCECHKEVDQVQKDLKALQIKYNEVANLFNQIKESSSFFGKHPIVSIFDYTDISEFDFSTGWADKTGKWAGWALCSGANYIDPTDATVTVKSPVLAGNIPIGGTTNTPSVLTQKIAHGADKTLSQIIYIIKVYDAK